MIPHHPYNDDPMHYHLHPVTIIIALDANGNALGHHYMDDEESLNEQYIFTKIEYKSSDNESKLTNSIIDKSNNLESVPQIEIERIVIIGKDLDKTKFTEIKIEQMTTSKSTKQFGFLPNTLAVRKPNIYIN